MTELRIEPHIGSHRSDSFGTEALFDVPIPNNPSLPTIDISGLASLPVNSMEEVLEIISLRGLIIDASKLRIDILERHFERGGLVTFFPNFPTSDLQLEQGWDTDGVMAMINCLGSSYGIPHSGNPQDIIPSNFTPYVERILQDLPPLFLRARSNGVVDLEDGNHRWGTCHMIGVTTAPAFLMSLAPYTPV